MTWTISFEVDGAMDHYGSFRSENAAIKEILKTYQHNPYLAKRMLIENTRKEGWYSYIGRVKKKTGFVYSYYVGDMKIGELNVRTGTVKRM